MQVVVVLLSVFLCVGNFLEVSLAHSIGVEQPQALCPQYIGPPCPYYYNNTMDDYEPGNSTTALLASLQPQMTEFLPAYVQFVLGKAPPNVKVANTDTCLYWGSTGRASLFLKLYLNTGNTTYLQLAKTYVDLSIAVQPITYTGMLGMLKSFTGTFAVGAVIYDILGETANRDKYIAIVQKAMPYGLKSVDWGLESGIPGLLTTAFYLNWYFNTTIIPQSDIDNLAIYIVEAGIQGGQTYGNGTYLLWNYPLGLGWKSWGQGLGMFGTLMMILQVPAVTSNPTYATYLRNTVDYLVAMQLPDGQFPDPYTYALSEAGIESEHSSIDVNGSNDDFHLVQWCHGAPGALALYTKAYSVFGDNRYLLAAEKASDYIWEKGLLTKGLQLCHGIAGNTYMFIYLYKASNNEKYLWRALKFQEFVMSTPIVSNLDIMRVPTPYTYGLWVGSQTGSALLWADMMNKPANTWCIPGWEICN